MKSDYITSASSPRTHSQRPDSIHSQAPKSHPVLSIAK